MAEIASRMEFDLIAAKLSGLELDAVRTLALEKYSGYRWTERR